ncbi:MAG TPA: UDP-N-acetylglucosamine 2-epimerase (non-hydrolyzing) [Anaerolineales bacterium]|nr:UDP-N-acetylglucosamine 2-epimerase (non-hydrolyzing) [Anaerolineales bacterium]
MTLRVLSIFGTRPEAVKMAPVIQTLAHSPGVVSMVCVTAQHRQMLDQVLGLFSIRPDLDLNLMRPDQDLASLTAAIITHLDPVLADLKPDWILVQGDTTTVLASSLVAFYRRIRVGHVEAGLRTHDKWQPFPEEINRRLASVVADLHFAPTEWARQNLLSENIPTQNIVVTGNPVIDALQAVAQMPATLEVLALFKNIGIPYQSIPTSGDARMDIPRLILVTAHRRENFGKPLEDICSALKQLSDIYRDRVRIVYPIHLNPNVQKPVHRLLDDIPNIILLAPLDYLPLVHLMRQASLVLTDSGGLQEEAPAFGKPVLVMRLVTERPEGIQAGTVRLVGTDPQVIIDQTCRLLDDPQAYAAMAQAINPYGDGKAAERIVKAILEASK